MHKVTNKTLHFTVQVYSYTLGYIYTSWSSKMQFSHYRSVIFTQPGWRYISTRTSEKFKAPCRAKRLVGASWHRPHQRIFDSSFFPPDIAIHISCDEEEEELEIPAFELNCEELCWLFWCCRFPFLSSSLPLGPIPPLAPFPCFHSRNGDDYHCDDDGGYD